MAKLVRKNVFVNQGTLSRARRILGTRTESQAIREALEIVAFREEVARGFDRAAGAAAGYRDPWSSK